VVTIRITPELPINVSVYLCLLPVEAMYARAVLQEVGVTSPQLSTISVDIKAAQVPSSSTWLLGGENCVNGAAGVPPGSPRSRRWLLPEDCGAAAATATTRRQSMWVGGPARDVDARRMSVGGVPSGERQPLSSLPVVPPPAAAAPPVQAPAIVISPSSFAYTPTPAAGAGPATAATWCTNAHAANLRTHRAAWFASKQRRESERVVERLQSAPVRTAEHPAPAPRAEAVVNDCRWFVVSRSLLHLSLPYSRARACSCARRLPYYDFVIIPVASH
jgi:hypothetical protein